VLPPLDGQVILRPVIEDDLSWLDRLRNDPAATGLHERRSVMVLSKGLLVDIDLGLRDRAASRPSGRHADTA
jgi:hypothetical protein